MKDEYDFTGAEQGKFYRPLEALEIPIYLDQDNRDYFIRRLRTRQNPRSLNEVVNALVRKDIEISQQLVD
ncbi:hypothetical protein [Halochromatium roseum]|uniref:hypothetical protein n=1 Tax=Halochromatium roseum TaxID=391920 RepID=UPI0019125938|nr:hypothetical protein [Halochromatium roseum]MBK5938854.1 hypothetical protein [Halochromatium roseum]